MGANDVRTDQLRGRRVIDKTGNVLGSIEDLTVDPASLRVTAFIVKVDRAAADRLHIEHPMMGSARVEVAVDRLSSIGDSVLLNIDQRDMAGMLYGGPNP